MDRQQSPSLIQQAVEINPLDWRDGFLLEVIKDEQVKEDLFALLYTLWDFNDSPDSIDFISKLFDTWVHEGKDLNVYRYDIRNLFSTVNDLRNISLCYEIFNINSEYQLKHKPESK